MLLPNVWQQQIQQPFITPLPTMKAGTSMFLSPVTALLTLNVSHKHMADARAERGDHAIAASGIKWIYNVVIQHSTLAMV